MPHQLVLVLLQFLLEVLFPDDLLDVHGGEGLFLVLCIQNRRGKSSVFEFAKYHSGNTRAPPSSPNMVHRLAWLSGEYPPLI